MAEIQVEYREGNRVITVTAEAPSQAAYLIGRTLEEIDQMEKGMFKQ